LFAIVFDRVTLSAASFGKVSDLEGKDGLQEEKTSMRKEYDFSKAKGRKNRSAKELKKQITIRLRVDILEYFK